MGRILNPRNAASFLAEQRRLLQMEYESEKQAFSDLTGRIGIERLKERGNAWFPVRMTRTYHNSLNQRIIEITAHQEEAEIENEHNFEYGRPVAFFTTDSKNSFRTLFTGTVSFVDNDRMAVAVPESADTGWFNTDGELGIMLSFDETSFRTMFGALDSVAAAKGRLGELRDLIYSHRPGEELKLPDISVPFLNDAQQKAVNKVLRARDVAVVHGPPGTGKTTTLVEAIHETLRKESQVLVCAQSNMAVDLICERLSERGISVLRIGNPSRVTDRMLESAYERRFEAHPDYPSLWSVRKAIRELRGHRHRSDQWHRKIEGLKSKAVELELRINNDIFNDSKVIASTLVSSAHRVLDGRKFHSVFIDEAAQALEAACWIAIRKAHRVILAGDHCQLPPTVKNYEAMKQGLGISLMERIVEYHPESVVLLSAQYRMHHDIMKFSSDWFYGGGMTAAKTVSRRTVLDFDIPFEWIESAPEASPGEAEHEGVSDSHPLQIIDHEENAYKETLTGANHGIVNVDEAILTVKTLHDYVSKISIGRILEENIDIAVISPYRAQVKYLRELIRATPLFRPIRKLITVNTVDGFQGRESDIVVISLVRSNERGQIGFLNDLRRMNVAMTRARMKLIMIGNRDTLTRHPFFKKLYRYVEQLKADTLDN